MKKGLCKTQSPFFCSYATEKIPSENENFFFRTGYMTTLIASIHPITLEMADFLPMPLFFLRRYVYNPNLFRFWRRRRKGCRFCRRLGSGLSCRLCDRCFHWLLRGLCDRPGCRMTFIIGRLFRGFRCYRRLHRRLRTATARSLIPIISLRRICRFRSRLDGRLFSLTTLGLAVL